MKSLEISQLSHYFGKKRALHRVNLSIETGQFVALLGLNGAGKTTLFSLITRLFAHQSGSLRIFGHELHKKARAALSLMGVVFQMPTLDLDLTVEQNLHYHGALHGMNRRQIEQRMVEELTRIGSMQDAHRRIRTLSGGQRRRIEIARALLHRPRLLILDEPTVGLDMESRAIITKHIHQLCSQEQLSVLWATHLIDEVHLDDQLVILHEGQIKMAGQTQSLLKKHNKKEINDLFISATKKEPVSS